MSSEIVILLSLIIASLTIIVWKFIDTWGKRSGKYYEVKALAEAEEALKKLPEREREIMQLAMGIIEKQNNQRDNLINMLKGKK